MKIVFSVLILLALDLLIFYITHNVTKTYVKEQRIISNNLETLITSVETTKLGSYCVAVKDGDKTYFEEYYIYHDEKYNRDLIVPDSLKREFVMTFKDMKRFFKTILDTLIKRVSIFV